MKQVLLLMLTVTLLFNGASNIAQAATDCNRDKEVVEDLLSGKKTLGEEKFEILLKLISNEKIIAIVENPECKKTMKQYVKDLPALKTEEEELEKLLKED